uniref:POU class 6 n=1 Tax=Eleutheria dichotoma TaxID=13050 RepID=A7XAL9_9CNID|nr:POU class 6 [Eleutheria dichotoma]
MADWQDYFSKTRPPSNLDEAKRTIQDFATKHRQLGRNIVLVTSGGTTVPIESNTVRFVDNFSQGTRGACSAEYFLMHGYAVVFLHRQRSLEPFCRHFEGHTALDLLELQLETTGAYRVVVDEARAPILPDIVRKYKEVQNGCLLLKIGFMTLSDYLFLLKASAEALAPLGSHIMFYLAAAVSDFYVPENEMSEHKIQSTDSSFQLSMTPTPKMLSPLVKEWAKSAFVVSFKLETDVNIISRKAREALQRYNHQVVIANILQTRRKTVVLVTPFDEMAIWMSDHELEMGKEIEEKIVNELTRRHLSINSGNLDNQGQSSPVVNANVFSPAAQQFTSEQSIIQTSLSNNSVTSMPGLAPINVYQNNAINVKPGSAISNVLLQLKGESEFATDILPATMLKRSVSAKEDRCMLTFEMQEFIREFKKRRINLGYTQDDVGRELSALNGPTYSQSFISRFEGKQLGMKAAERMRPILETWIQSKEEEHSSRSKFTKKRRKRTSFSPEVLDMLNDLFMKNPKPSFDEMNDIARQINRDVTTVKVWFCNKKQSLKRLGHPILSSIRSPAIREEMIDIKRKRKSDADIQDVFALNHNNIKTLVTTTSANGPVTVPFFIAQDGNSIAIMSGGQTSSAQTVTPAGSSLTTTMPQQIVHLSPIPMLASMAVMNNSLSGSQTVDGTNAHVLSNGRVIHSGAVIQIANNPIQNQTTIRQNSTNDERNANMNDTPVIMTQSENIHASEAIEQSQSTNIERNRLDLVNSSSETPLNSSMINSHITEAEDSEEESLNSSGDDEHGNFKKGKNIMEDQIQILPRSGIKHSLSSTN